MELSQFNCPSPQPLLLVSCSLSPSSLYECHAFKLIARRAGILALTKYVQEKAAHEIIISIHPVNGHTGGDKRSESDIEKNEIRG